MAVRSAALASACALAPSLIALRACAPAAPAREDPGYHKWSYTPGVGTQPGAASSAALAPPAPAAPPAPPSRLAALGPGPAALPLPRGRAGAAAAGGAASRSTWAVVTADTLRRDSVREAMRHAWSSYAANAFGFDELMPAAKRGKNGFGGMGATIVDALDTLHIMGLDDEFRAARGWVAKQLTFSRSFDASVFETTIRIVGGLLSANHLTGDELFVEKARELADRLLPAFDTPTGIPFSTVNLKTGRTRNAVRMRTARRRAAVTGRAVCADACGCARRRGRTRRRRWRSSAPRRRARLCGCALRALRCVLS